MGDKTLVPIERIEKSILLIRGHKVMLSVDLAKLYGVGTKILNQAVKRNIKRFPEDFMFQLTNDEVNAVVSQNVTPHIKYFGGHLPYSFTEQGVAMLSGILKSDRAIEVNIQIMRAFVQMRKLIASNTQLAQRLDELERRADRQDANTRAVFEAIKQLMEPPMNKRKPIGFKANDD